MVANYALDHPTGQIDYAAIAGVSLLVVGLAASVAALPLHLRKHPKGTHFRRDTLIVGIRNLILNAVFLITANASFTFIRATSPDELGQHVVVQGGTFYNDAVLRAFERELGKNVIRPSIAGLMGAYGAALYSKKLNASGLLSKSELEGFVHNAKASTCHGCTNNCRLTINSFGEGKKKYISGNQCERGLGYDTSLLESVPNLHAFKRAYLKNLSSGNGTRGTVGIPMALGIYELYPLWHGIFTSLGFRVIASEQSTHKTYQKGQFSIPSDTGNSFC